MVLVCEDLSRRVDIHLDTKRRLAKVTMMNICLDGCPNRNVLEELKPYLQHLDLRNTFTLRCCIVPAVSAILTLAAATIINRFWGTTTILGIHMSSLSRVKPCDFGG
jgi:hypothetical protein